jgi:hypothetical protein
MTNTKENIVSNSTIDEIEAQLDFEINKKKAKVYKEARVLLMGVTLTKPVEPYTTRRWGEKFTKELSRKVKSVDLFRFNTSSDTINKSLSRLASELDDLYYVKRNLLHNFKTDGLAKTLFNMVEYTKRQQKERDKVENAIAQAKKTLSNI